MQKKDIDTAGKTETFLTRNVKLVTFLVCVAVLLGGAGVWSFIRFYEPADNRPEMTLEDVRDLSTRVASLREKDFDAFKGQCEEEKIEGTVVARHYYINGIEGRYNLSATVLASDGKTMYLELYDMERHAEIDLLSANADLESFLIP